jgi:ubiquinone biosynthesis protein COQ9
MEEQDKVSVLDKLGSAALALATAHPWNSVPLRDICEAAGIALSDCVQLGITKPEIEAALDKRLDHAMMEAAASVDRTHPVRDRLFDILMGRFDALEDARAAWTSIFLASQNDPVSQFARRVRRLRCAAWALEAAGISSSDLSGIGRTLGLAFIVRQIDAVWLKDDVDLAKTMAQLDKALREAESRVLGFADLQEKAARWGFRANSKQGNDMPTNPATPEPSHPD